MLPDYPLSPYIGHKLINYDAAMRTWLRRLVTVISGRRYQRRLQHDQVADMRATEEIGLAREGIIHPRGGGLGM
jgi:hypothetical protein